MVFWIGISALLVLGGLMVYVRVMSDDPARWHAALSGDQDRETLNSVFRVIEGDRETLGQLDSHFTRLPRTTHLAGSLDTGHLTYVTRSAFWRFPDYTTLELADGKIRLFARARYGKSDLGVNRARLREALGAIK